MTLPAAGSFGVAPTAARRRGLHRRPGDDEFAPTLGVALLFCALLFVFPSEVVLAGPLRSNGSPVRLLGFLALFLVVLSVLNVRRDPAPVRRVNGVVVVIVVYLAQSTLSYGVESGRSLSANLAASSLRYYLVLVAGCGIAMFLALWVRNMAKARLLLGVLLAGSVLNATVGLLQAAGAQLSWAEVVRLPGLDFTSNPGVLRERLDFVRVLGTTSHPIEYAVCLAATLPIAIHLSRFASRPLGRGASRLAVGMILLASPFALSRSGLLCIAAAILFHLPFATGSQRALMAVGVVVGPALAIVVAPQVVTAFVELFGGLSVTSTEDESISGRLNDYPIVDAVFEAHPVLGGVTGVDNLVLDNQWLEFLVSGGLVAVVGFAVLLLFPVVMNTRAALRRPRSLERSSLAGAVGAGLIASGIAAYTFDTVAFQQSVMLIFILVGLTSCVVEDSTEQGPPAHSPALPELGRRTAVGAP